MNIGTVQIKANGNARTHQKGGNVRRKIETEKLNKKETRKIRK